MNKPEKITGEWIKKEYDKAFSDFKLSAEKDTHVTFIYSPWAKKFDDKVKKLQKICPHKYENNTCVYCRKHI